MATEGAAQVSAGVPPAQQASAEDEAARQKRIADLVARNEAPVLLSYLRGNDDGATPSAHAKAATSKKEEDKGAKKGKKDKGNKDRPKGACINHFLGLCTYGDKCRFSHDVKAYLATRLPDLLGTCPFVNTGSCPYGIACRYAGTHTATDELHAQLRAHLLEQQPQQAQQHDLAAASAAPTAAGADAPGGSAAPAAAGAQALQGPVLLPVPETVQQPFNTMSKDLQRLLWKNRYDFTKADGVLKDLGLRVSVRPAKPLPGEDKQHHQQQGGKNAKQQQQRHGGQKGAAAAAAPSSADGAAAAPQGAEAAEPAPEAQGAGAMDAEATAVPSGQEAQQQEEPVGAEAAEPERKRARVEGGDGASASAGASAAALQENVAQHVEVPLRREEKRVIDFRGKTVLAPLTTVGNLPFRRVCKKLGADVTVGEMALATNLLQGQASEWALLKRHPCEDLFGVQIAGGFPDTVARACQLIDETCTSVDYVDINMGCPIDIVCDRGAGSALLLRPKRIAEIAKAADRSMSLPLTLKTRKGYHDDQDVTHTFVDQIRSWGPIALTLHGRTRQQRYSKTADWNYIERCAELAHPTGLQLVGNGDVFSYVDWNEHVGNGGGALASCMIGRGALIKPWLFTEIKEQRHWDISAGERLDLLRDFASAGLTHWGSDGRGVETTRRFMLEWLSYMHRYLPVGLLEVVPQKLHWRQPRIYGRSDLETLLSSDNPVDWIHISEMLLGRAPEGFTFTPKHKSTSYAPPSAAAAAAGTSAAPDAGEQDDMAEG